MKVTVCFGPVRVIVPCGQGDMLVRDLIRQAVHRYKKATGKGSESWVSVQCLQTERDGGILDPDDRLLDVADDREQIIAKFGEGEGPHHPTGDGASGSSVGTSSPDIFHGGGERDKYSTDIEVTNEQIGAPPAQLQVRRGSEPALNQLIPTNGVGGGPVAVVSDPSKRWSAAPLITEPRDRPLGRKDDGGRGGYYGEKWGALEEEEVTPAVVTHRVPGHFARDHNNRLSMQFFGDNGYRWWEAAEKASLHTRMQSLSLPREHKRKDPVGQATPHSPLPLREGVGGNSTEDIVLETCGGAMLGLHVVPDYDPLGREVGLLVQGVEPGGRVDTDGRLAVNDRIIDINGNNLIDKPFPLVQEIFRDSLRCPELRLKVVKGSRVPGRKIPPAVLPKPTVAPAATPTGRGVAVGLQTANTRRPGRRVDITLIKGQFGLGFSVTTRDNPASRAAPIYIKNILPKGAAVEDGRLRPGDRLLAVDGVEVTGKSQGDVVAILRNVPPGESVSLVVSRQTDSLPPNLDQMSVENHRVTPSPNAPTTPKVVTTPAEKDTAPHLPVMNGVQNEAVDDSCVYPWRQREILTLDIPVHDTEKAGLGVSVKGKTSSSNNSGQNSGTSIDLGIFVKSVIHGGAASRDGRLKMNDQLLSVNGISLLGQGNTVAMETLRRALVRSDGPVPGHITLTVARKLQSNSNRTDSVSSLLTDSSANTETFGGKIEDSVGNPAETSATSDNSDSTVIFMPPYNKNNADAVNQNQPNHLMGNLRNESYYRATHQTSMMLNGTRMGAAAQPTESPILEDEPLYSPHRGRRPSESEKVNGVGTGGQQRGSTSSTQTTGDITYASQLSLDDQAAGFSRDAFGRQSMSEKRHAALDAKNTDTYQRNKKAREERDKLTRENRLVRVNSAESIAKLESARAAGIEQVRSQLGPSLGMKKSSSLESLQTMVQEMQLAEEGGGRSGGGVRVVRGRGCNESFRAAVDRLAPHNLQTVTEDEDGVRQGHNTSMESKASKGKKRPSLLKGIGSMFRFGKQRKESVGGGGGGGGQGLPTEEEREAARRAATEEQERVQEQYRRLMLRQHHFHQQQQQQEEEGVYNGVNNNGGNAVNNGTNEANRTDRINQLRAEHQRRHMERRGVYPHDDREERYEQHIKQRLEGGSDYGDGSTGAMNRPGSRLGITDPSRFSHYVNYHEIQQHLKEEIAAVKLRHPKRQEPTGEENRRQQHYHSQRAAPREQVHRPVSNFYEYESVQAMLRAQALDPNSNSLPRRNGPDFISHSGVVNNNTVSKAVASMGYGSSQRYTYYSSGGTSTQVVQNGYGVYGQRKAPTGPFVTHVTVNETQHRP